MSATGRYVRPGHGATAPDSIFAVVCMRSMSYGSCDETVTEYERAGSAVAHVTRRRGRWGAPTVAVLPAEMPPFDYVQTHALSRKRNYVVTPDGAPGLALAGVWEAFDRELVEYAPRGVMRAPKKRRRGPVPTVALRRVALTPRCTLLDYLCQERSVVWLGTGNYVSATEDEVARDNGFQWPDTGEWDGPDRTTVRTAKERALLWVYVFARLSDWWRRVAAAPWGMTSSALGAGVLRSHVAEKELCTHNHAGALSLERAASYGGSARVWYYGEIGDPAADATGNNPAPRPSGYGSVPGPLECWDVRSMYPWLMTVHALPSRFYSYREDVCVADLNDALSDWAVVARVTIETDSPEFPARSGSFVVWPVGTFTTTLTGPELLALRRTGRVKAVHALARYHTSRCYGAAAAALLEERTRARDDGRFADELFAKSVANGMGGKLAQKRGTWKPAPRVSAPVRWGEWVEAGRGGATARRHRTLAGLTWVYETDADPWGPHVAAFAYLTALGRLHLRSIRESLPDRSVVQCDTDGLWILPGAFAAVRARADAGGDAPGRLRLAHRADNARFLGPRHYYAGGEWVLSGFTRPTIAADGITVADVHRIASLADGRGGPGRFEVSKARESVLKVESRGVKIGADGWTAPRSIQQRAPRIA